MADKNYDLLRWHERKHCVEGNVLIRDVGKLEMINL